MYSYKDNQRPATTEREIESELPSYFVPLQKQTFGFFGRGNAVSVDQLRCNNNDHNYHRKNIVIWHHHHFR
jgi:hypothetical protein